MIAGLIVGGSVLFAVAILVAAIASPGFRAWLEAPKHQFQDRLRDYDRRPSYPDADGGRAT